VKPSLRVPDSRARLKEFEAQVFVVFGKEEKGGKSGQYQIINRKPK